MVPIIAQLLLFLLLMGMAASVDVLELRQKLRRYRGLCTGLASQFLLLPLLGFICVKSYDLEPVFGLALLAVTSSPGGAYSNWWCSVFNADLALSVAMTTCSTLLSLVMTPANMVLYMYLAYGEIPNLRWDRLIASIVVAFSAICCGLGISCLFPGARKFFNIAGNIAGLALIIFSAAVSLTEDSEEPIWNKEPKFYLAVSTPIILGLFITFPACLAIPNLSRPEAVAITVETCYQNTGLALTVALASFDEELRGKATAVPLFYGCVQVLLLPLFLVVAWKAGFTYCPAGAPVCKVLFSDHQPRSTVQMIHPEVDEGADEGNDLSGEQDAKKFTAIMPN